jgi:hypothetical protein
MANFSSDTVEAIMHGMTFKMLKGKLNHKFYIQENYCSKLDITHQYFFKKGRIWMHLQTIMLSNKSEFYTF